MNQPSNNSFQGRPSVRLRLSPVALNSNVRAQDMSLHLVADLKANYARFVTRVRETGTVWGLRSEEGWAICPSNEYDCDVMPFWSDEAYAKRHAVKEWAAYTATPITIDSFIDNWLRGMHEDDHLVGVNFNADLAGLEVEPVDLAKELTAEL